MHTIWQNLILKVIFFFNVVVHLGFLLYLRILICWYWCYVHANKISGKGVILCIENALADSGVTKEDINYINAHATSTQMGDLKEFEALNRCFGQNPQVILYFIIFYFRPSNLLFWKKIKLLFFSVWLSKWFAYMYCSYEWTQQSRWQAIC